MLGEALRQLAAAGRRPPDLPPTGAALSPDDHEALHAFCMVVIGDPSTKVKDRAAAEAALFSARLLLAAGDIELVQFSQLVVLWGQMDPQNFTPGSQPGAESVYIAGLVTANPRAKAKELRALALSEAGQEHSPFKLGEDEPVNEGKDEPVKKGKDVLVKKSDGKPFTVSRFGTVVSEIRNSPH